MARFTTQDQQSLVSILLRYWEEIAAIEETFDLRVGRGDGRPRIEFFHDAIRAYTAPHKTPALQQRLAIEQLAYDVRCLRYLATMPLASITHDHAHLSAGSELVVVEPGLVGVAKRIDRSTKERLQELYEQYGVLFAALLKSTANQDAQERSDTLNHDVEQIDQLIEAIKQQASAAALATLVQHLEDEALKRDLQALLPQIKGKQGKALSGLLSKLKASIQKKDKQLKTIDNAAHAYATAQLVIYENAKDMLKKMASQGMNLVGQFVESTMRTTGQGRGR